jgi:phospholipid/cholesterol/gamma-HCH transport system substrate-binding protein
LILKKINSSEGSLGLLVNNPSLYQNLNSTSDNLNKLLVDFRENPKRYVHFSAIDIGKGGTEPLPDNVQFGDSVIFKVLILSSNTQVSPDSPLFKGISNIEELKYNHRYDYFAGKETSYDKIIVILNKVQSAFPEASLKAFRKGKEISLKKALKTISK